MRIVRAAVVQDSPIVFDREATIEKVNSLISQATRQGASLVVMPEAFVSAYPTGLDFGARVGLRQPKGRDDFRRYYESALEVPGPACDALAKAAREAGVYLVIGVIERDGVNTGPRTGYSEPLTDLAGNSTICTRDHVAK
jgi:nitrilase